MAGQRILVVDDDPQIVEVCTKALRASGFVVERSLEGREAIVLLKEREFDLLIVDLMMPDVDGLEILRVAREYAPLIAGIVITGCETMEKAIESIRVGAQDFLEKPFTPEDLIVAVEDLLERRQSLYEDLRLELWVPILGIIDPLTTEIDLDQLSRLIVETIKFGFRADHVSLLLLDDRGEQLSVAAVIGLPNEVIEARYGEDRGVAYRALQMGNPITLSIEADLDSLAVDETEQADAFWAVCLPLQTRGQVIGVLDVSRLPGSPAFEQNDLQLLSMLCGPIAIAIENARLYAESRQQADELIALWHIGQDITSTLDQQTVLERIARWAGQLVGSDGVALYLLLDSNAGLLQPVVSLGPPTTKMPQIPTEVGEGIISRVAQTGLGEIVNHVNLDPKAVQIPGTLKEEESLLCVPILSRGKVIGVMSLNRLGDRFFRDDDLHLLSRIAHQAAIAIENARLYEEAQRRAIQLAAAAEVSRDAISTLDMGQLLTNTVNLIRDRFGFYHAGVFLVDDAGGYAVLRAATGEAGQKMLEQQHKLKVGEVGIVGHVVGRGEPHIALDVGLDAVHFDNPLLPNTRSEMALPLTVRGRVIGALDVQSVEEAAFSAEDVAILQTMADQLAIAIENARLYEEERRRAEELATLNAITKTVSRSLDLDTILDEALDKVFEVIDADAGRIYLLDEGNDELTLVVYRSFSEPFLQKMRHLKVGEGAIGQTAQSVRPVLLDSLTADDGLLTEVERAALEEGIHSEVNVPLSTRGRVHGVLSIARHQEWPFTSREVELLAAVGNQVAVAIENARLYKKATERMRGATALHRVSGTLMRTLNLEQLLENILEVLQRSFGYSHCAIFLVDEKGENLCIEAARGYLRDMVGKPGSKIDQEGIVGWVATNRMSLNVPDVTQDDRYIGRVRGVGAEIAVPMLFGEKVVGVLDVQSTKINAFGEDDLRNLSSIAAQAAVAVERARLYEATLAERERTERIVTSIADGLITVDRELRVLSLNPAAEQMTGWQEAEAVGRLCVEVLGLTSESGESLCDASCKKLSGHNFPRAKIARKDDRPIYVSASLAPLLGPADQVMGGVIAIRDCSAEIELDRMKSEMVTMVSHELRSPLANMQTAIELVLTSDFEEDLQREMLNIVRSQCTRLASFVEELLDVSQLDAGQIAMRQEPVTLWPLIQRVVNTFEATDQRGHHLQVVGRDELPFAWADPRKVEVILNNLLQNAANYSPKGSTITIEAKTMDNANISVSVSDEGEGIASENLEQIFQPYYRVGDSNGEKVSGRGLGLYIVQKLVEMQGGRVWVESEVGRGSHFIFTLPKMEG
jgi:PAS domain S-box-containing protein